MKNLVATLTVSELHNVLANAMMFSSTDVTTPVLSSVRLTEHNEELLAEATDRYRLAEVLAVAENVPTDLDLLIPLALVKQIIGALKLVPKRDASKVLVNIFQVFTESQIEDNTKGYGSSRGSVVVELATGSVIAGEMLTGDYPKTRSLFPDALPDYRDAAGVWLINPAYMGDMMKVKHVDGSSKGQATRISGGLKDGKPVSVEHGGWFRGLIMPVRMTDNSALVAPSRFI